MFSEPGICYNQAQMGREEQIEEREVLDSIFPEEITGSLTGVSCSRAGQG